METDDIIKKRIETVIEILDERQRRHYLAAEAQSIGRGGVSKIAKLASVTRRTVAKGIIESSAKEPIAHGRRIRKEGGSEKACRTST